MTLVAVVIAVVAWVLVVHTFVNTRLLRTPPSSATMTERVSILLPVRDEANRVVACVTAIRAQRGLPDVEVIVVDDGSADGTAALARAAGGDAIRVLDGEPLPDGVVGKAAACAQLADAAHGDVLVFVDADVTLADDAVARAIATMRARDLGYVAPYPRQIAGSWLERLIQPLLTWSWMTFLPLRIAERSPRPSLAAANGQFLVVDATAYRASGGHARVVHDVVDDMALARLLRRNGIRGGFVDGSRIATCRMYDDGRDVVDGYAKSLWAAFGSPANAVVVTLILVAVYVLPWVLLAARGLVFLPAALAGPAGRIVSGLRTGDRVFPDALVHPLSILAFVFLVVVSIVRHARGTARWKGRVIR